MVTHGSSGPVTVDFPAAHGGESHGRHVNAAETLSRQLAGWDAAVRRSWEQGREAISSGFRQLDQLLPAGGVRRGSLIEWLAADDAAGAVALACAVACRLAAPRTARHAPGGELAAANAAATILVVDRGGRFHPPAVLPWLDAAGRGAAARPQLVVARPSTDDDELWTIDQSLRCPGVAAVLAWPGRVHATAMRRWQLAARSGGAVGLLVRGPVCGGASVGREAAVQAAALHGRRMRASVEPTWAEARVAVQPLPDVGEPVGPSVRRLRLSLVGGPWEGEAMLQDRAAEVLLDMAGGCEAIGRRCELAVPCPTRSLGRETLQRGVLECRAS